MGASFQLKRKQHFKVSLCSRKLSCRKTVYTAERRGANGFKLRLETPREAPVLPSEPVPHTAQAFAPHLTATSTAAAIFPL